LDRPKIERFALPSLVERLGDDADAAYSKSTFFDHNPHRGSQMRATSTGIGRRIDFGKRIRRISLIANRKGIFMIFCDLR